MKSAVFAALFVFIFLTTGFNLNANAEVRGAPADQDSQEDAGISASQVIKELINNYGGVSEFNGNLYDFNKIDIPEELQKYWDRMKFESVDLCKASDGALFFCFNLKSLPRFKEITRARSIHYLRIDRNENGTMHYNILGVKRFYIDKSEMPIRIYNHIKKFCTIKEPCGEVPCPHPKDKCEHKQDVPSAPLTEDEDIV